MNPSYYPQQGQIQSPAGAPMPYASHYQQPQQPPQPYSSYQGQGQEMAGAPAQISFFDAASQDFFGDAEGGEDGQMSDPEVDNVPALVEDGMGFVTITRVLHMKASPEGLASDPEARSKDFTSTVDLEELRSQNIKLVPKSIRVTEIQNGLPYPVGVVFTNKDGARGLKINSNNVTASDQAKVDVVLREGCHTPYMTNQGLYVTDPDKDIDLRPFQNMHTLSKEELKSGVVQRSQTKHHNMAYADVVMGSAVQKLAAYHSDFFRLDGNNVFIHPRTYYKGDQPFQLVRLPLHVVDRSIEWGNQVIDSLPFQDPADLVATVVRLDGKPFDEMDNETDETFNARTTKVPFGLTIEEVYAPFAINNPAASGATVAPVPY